MRHIAKCQLISWSWGKRFGEDYDDAIFVDECTVELKFYNPTNWRKDGQPLLSAAGGKLGKSKHGFKVHLFGGIS